MQDQGRRLLIAVALALGVMFTWNQFFSPTDEKKEDSAQTQGSSGSGTGVTPGVPAGATVQGNVGQPANPVTASAPVAQRGPEQLETFEFPGVHATFSNHGGVLKSWHLMDKRYDRDKFKGELLPVKQAPGAFAVSFPGSTYDVPAQAEWVGKRVSDREIIYSYSTSNLTVEKRFVIVPESYIVKLTVSAKFNVPEGQQARQTLAVSIYGFHDPADDGGGGQSVAPRRWESSTYRDGELFGTTVNAVQKRPRFEYDIRWTGFEHPYMLVAFAPKPAPGLSFDKQTFAEGNEGLMRTDVLFRPSATLKAGITPLVHEAAAYLGPKNYTELEAADEVAGFSTAFTGTIDLGWFGFIGRPLMWLLLKFYAFFGNWGLAIMLLTIVVKGLTIPFTTKSMRSMKAMAVLAPQMKGLQEKYKDDKQRLQMETMALYKQHGANPLTGCLPLILQMPIWLALYRMLSSTGELYQQAFIPGWIDDLTNTDPFYIMPIVLMATMFAQARLTPMGPATDPSQKLQQRMMQYGMPLMFGVMAFFFPAGLTLYIFTNTILSAMHSIYMNKFDKKSLELAAKIKAAQEAAAQQKTQVAASKAKDANPPKDAAADGGSTSDASSKPRPRPGGANRKKGQKPRR